MSSSIILFRFGTEIWLSAMYRNLEKSTGFRVLVVKGRKEGGKLGEDATGLKFWMKFFYSVSVFMTNGLEVIIVLWNVATLIAYATTLIVNT